MLYKLLLIVVFCGSVNNMAAQGNQAAKTAEAAPLGISLIISSDQSVVKQGAEVWLKVVLTNTSRHKIFLNTEKDPDPNFGFSVDVRDEHGAQAKDTKEGHMRKRDISIDTDSGAPLIFNFSPGPQIFLQPGETHTAKVNLAKLLDLRPGKYSVRVNRPDTAEAVNDQDSREWPIANSNQITITMIP
jgi:hypothetical protein